MVETADPSPPTLPDLQAREGKRAIDLLESPQKEDEQEKMQ